MNARRAVVTGLGIVSPVGIGAEATWDGLVAGRSGIDTITLFDASEFDVDVAGEVKGFDATNYMDAKDARRHDRSTHLAVAATGEALRDAGLLGDDGHVTSDYGGKPGLRHRKGAPQRARQARSGSVPRQASEPVCRARGTRRISAR